MRTKLSGFSFAESALMQRVRTRMFGQEKSNGGITALASNDCYRLIPKVKLVVAADELLAQERRRRTKRRFRHRPVLYVDNGFAG